MIVSLKNFHAFFAHNVQICAKFSCKNITDVWSVFWMLRHDTYGAVFCGHAVRLLKFLSRKTVRLTLLLYTVHCSNENTSDPGLQVKFQNIHNFRTKELLCTLTDLISLDITNRMNFLLIQVYDSYCRGVLVESPAADIIWAMMIVWKIRWEDYQNCSLLYCVWQLYTMIYRHIWTIVKDECWFMFSFCAFVYV